MTQRSVWSCGHILRHLEKCHSWPGLRTVRERKGGECHTDDSRLNPSMQISARMTWSQLVCVRERNKNPWLGPSIPESPTGELWVHLITPVLWPWMQMLVLAKRTGLRRILRSLNTEVWVNNRRMQYIWILFTISEILDRTCGITGVWHCKVCITLHTLDEKGVFLQRP